MRREGIQLLMMLMMMAVSKTWAAEPGDQPVDYLRDVKPILAKRCFACHGVLRQQGGLRLDTVSAIRLGGESGTSVVPGKPAESLLISAVTGSAGFRMPPENEGAPLSPAEIDHLRAWIQAGAVEPPGEQPPTDPRQFWSYLPVTRPEFPRELSTDRWPANGSDVWVRAKHHEQSVTPQPPADRATLLRRLYLDLIGIPPTPDELREFLADDRPDAVRRVVDELLASPLYGQRWGRHWMDVWRYSDWYGSRGINEIRYSQRHIWRWRDWIVESLNSDLGYDQMVLEMLAGDELAPGNLQVTRATGFLGRNWYKFDRNVWMFDTVEQTSQAFLGLTMRCARCHDHKFDPISQADYYHFRAFFEPHEVRTDPWSGDLATEKDATLGPVLRTGVSQVYDKQLEIPTYRFMRGDSRHPDPSQVMTPAVPAILGGPPLAIAPVVLPPSAVAPYLRDDVVAGLFEQQRVEIRRAQHQLETARNANKRLQEQIDRVESGETPNALPPAVFQDNFAVARPELWKPHGGEWQWVDGRLRQNQIGTFPTLLANAPLPRDFALRLRYTTLNAGTIHSVGFFFDVRELRDAQAVYTATNNTKASVQAFHRIAGVEHYPGAGVFPCSIQLNEPVTMDVAARSQQLNVWLNGELVLAYPMPEPRRDGTIALWTHAGTAEFQEISCHPLPDEFPLASSVSEKSRSPFDPPTSESLKRGIADAERIVHISERAVMIAESSLKSLEARVAADRAKLAAAANAAELAAAAAKSERELATLVAERDVADAERLKEQASTRLDGTDEVRKKGIAEAEAKLQAAQKAAEAARVKLASSGADYTALGPFYPATSTGRRLALARWIAHPSNPRTARVAVNHVWLRHFGEAIVPSVANFGPNGRAPSHPALLDWLASEFTRAGWSMKQLHRELVTSATYTLSSTEGPADHANLRNDPKNTWLWRMNPRRVESEVIRDSVLHVAGELDFTLGGPEQPESTGLDARRRSLYFRSTPNEKMPFLEVFDQANPNECYRRQESVVPQQSLALFNSSLSISVARRLATQLFTEASVDRTAEESRRFVALAFERILSRPPTEVEQSACQQFVERHSKLLVESKPTPFPAVTGNVTPPSESPRRRAAENLIHVLLNHHDFVTLR